MTARVSGRETEQGESADPGTSGFLESLSPNTLSRFENISPLICTIGIVIPYINNYLYLTLVMGIARILPQKDGWPAKHPLFAALLIVLISIIFDLLGFLKGAWYLLFLFSVVPMCLVQHWLNEYWDSIEPKGLLTRHGFSGQELVAIIVGSLFLGLLIVSFMMKIN